MMSTLERLIKYYTDLHDVDEDLTAISVQGDQWKTDGTSVGITRRSLNDATATSTYNVVAYKDKNTTLSTRMVFLMI